MVSKVISLSIVFLIFLVFQTYCDEYQFNLTHLTPTSGLEYFHYEAHDMKGKKGNTYQITGELNKKGELTLKSEQDLPSNDPNLKSFLGQIECNVKKMVQPFFTEDDATLNEQKKPLPLPAAPKQSPLPPLEQTDKHSG